MKDRLYFFFQTSLHTKENKTARLHRTRTNLAHVTINFYKNTFVQVFRFYECEDQRMMEAFSNNDNNTCARS